jgi:hypothetical protein
MWVSLRLRAYLICSLSKATPLITLQVSYRLCGRKLYPFRLEFRSVLKSKYLGISYSMTTALLAGDELCISTYGVLANPTNDTGLTYTDRPTSVGTWMWQKPSRQLRVTWNAPLWFPGFKLQHRKCYRVVPPHLLFMTTYSERTGAEQLGKMHE